MTSTSFKSLSKRLAFADFETKAIGPRPAYPPVPVGLSLLLPGASRPTYHAWGHPEGNNTTKNKVQALLKSVMRDYVTCWHNAGFDLDVAETYMCAPWPAEWHDTLLLAFLEDPGAATLSLKPLAEKWLGEPPEERDRLKEWILEHIEAATPKTWGAYIGEAPVKIVAPYANGDVTRTKKLFMKLAPEIMAETGHRARAYVRELKTTKALIRVERRGLPVATRKLGTDIAKYGAVKQDIEQKLMTWLKVPKAGREEFKWSGTNFAEQFVRSGRVEALPETEKGNPSTSAESLALVLPPGIAHEFEVRAQLHTCLNTFMAPWHQLGCDNAGLFLRASTRLPRTTTASATKARARAGCRRRPTCRT
jgi:hypothetical protein